MIIKHTEGMGKWSKIQGIRGYKSVLHKYVSINIHLVLNATNNQ